MVEPLDVHILIIRIIICMIVSSAATIAVAKRKYKVMLYVAMNNGYAQQLRLPHGLNTLLLTHSP